MNSAPWEVLGTLFGWFIWGLCALVVIVAAFVAIVCVCYALAGFFGAAKKRAAK